MVITSPSLDVDHPDREKECVVAIEAMFRTLTRKAARAGWTREDIAFGLLELSRNEVKDLMSIPCEARTTSDEGMTSSA